MRIDMSHLPRILTIKAIISKEATNIIDFETILCKEYTTTKSSI